MQAPPSPRVARRTSATVLLGAALLTLVLSLLPYGRALTYPIRLFVTVVHESSHALASILTGGSVEGMRVAPDGSGVAYARGGNALAIASAGYLGTTVLGATLLLACPRRSRARPVLQLVAAGTLVATVLLVSSSLLPLVLTVLIAGLLIVLGGGGSRSSPWRWAVATGAGLATVVLLMLLASQGALFTWLTGITLSVALFLAAGFLKPAAAHFLLAFLAVQCCLGAVSDLLTLIIVSANGSSHSDAVIMQSITGVPALLWALLWSGLALAALGIAVRAFLRTTISP